MIRKFFRMIKDVVFFFVEDIKGDFKTLKKILDGEYKSKYTKEDLKQMFNIKEILKTYWPFFLLLLATGCVSWFLAAKYYQIACNDFIVQNYVVDSPINNMFNNNNMLNLTLSG